MWARNCDVFGQNELCFRVVTAIQQQEEALYVNKATSALLRSDDELIRSASRAKYVTKIMTRADTLIEDMQHWLDYYLKN
jgi:hypothetical protein